MTYEAPRPLLVALRLAGAAVLEGRGAGVNAPALPLSHLHWMDAKDTCQLVEGLLPEGYECGLRFEFAGMPASRRARCPPCFHAHTPRSPPSRLPLLSWKDLLSFRGSVHDQ